MDLSFFNGRPFVDLITPDEGSADWLWAIRLDGDAVIRNYDESREIPSSVDLAGTSFIRAIYSELDTRLQFGTLDAVKAEVTLTPTKYAISDPDYASGMEEYPQVILDLTESIPPDPSPDRVAVGPTEEEETE